MTVLAGWAKGPGGWTPDAPARAVGLVTIALRIRPRLIRTLGERIATVDRMPLLGTVSYHDAEVGHPRSADQWRTALTRCMGADVPPAPSMAFPWPAAQCRWWTIWRTPCELWPSPPRCSAEPERRLWFLWSSLCKGDRLPSRRRAGI